LLEAGGIVLGKTNLHELSAGYTTTNLFTGATRNPYDLDRVPGGSSGGNGAAIAASLAPVALGEDTAGSVRVPAALTGIYGFRPTSGRYPGDGVVPLSPTLDTLGPMARSVDDIVLLDAVITGDHTALDRISLRDLRIGTALEGPSIIARKYACLGHARRRACAGRKWRRARASRHHQKSEFLPLLRVALVRGEGAPAPADRGPVMGLVDTADRHRPHSRDEARERL
jgi:Asp-tRNA(Asn)/Glu-tRNA(Gln) amidotransferase A subunit family amidase